MVAFGEFHGVNMGHGVKRFFIVSVSDVPSLVEVFGVLELRW